MPDEAKASEGSDLLLEMAGSCQSHPCVSLRDSAQAVQGNKTESQELLILSVPWEINLNFSESVSPGTIG